MKKIVILTGACGKFGSFISKELIKNKEIIPVLITSKKIKKKNYHQINIKKKESIIKIFLYIRKKYGEPDVLINNAAVNTLKGFNDFVKNSRDEKIIDTYTVNSISSLLFIKYFLKKNKKGKEKKIINMLTRHAIWGNKRHVEYYSSKASLYNATKTLSKDYPKEFFANLMLGQIGNDKENCNQNVIWEEIQNIIFEKISKNYKEIYFESFKHFIKITLCNFMSYFRDIKIITPNRK